MVTYLDEEQAREDGIVIVHEPASQRFAVRKDADVIGEAHYTLIGDTAINFDHTFVAPSHRGTGLSAILAKRAVTDEIVSGRRVLASCWYIAEFLSQHPELVADPA